MQQLNYMVSMYENRSYYYSRSRNNYPILPLEETSICPAYIVFLGGVGDKETGDNMKKEQLIIIGILAVAIWYWYKHRITLPVEPLSNPCDIENC